MNKLPLAARAKIIGLMVEGMSIRAISRTTGASKNTVVKLLADAGEALWDYQNRALRGLRCKSVQCDEIWSFVYSKDKNAPAALKEAGEAGDVWTWTAICADSKLIVSWMVGDRTYDTGKAFMDDLRGRLANRVQLTTDGHRVYIKAVWDTFGTDVDYAVLQKLYGKEPGLHRDPTRRYSPAECTGVIREHVCGKPDKDRVSTSYVERQNLSMRMGMRRFTRLTNAFSKKLANHEFALAIYFMHYNFARIHQTLRVTPAMEAGVAKSVMSLEEMVGIVDAYWAAPRPIFDVATPLLARPESRPHQRGT